MVHAGLQTIRLLSDLVLASRSLFMEAELTDEIFEIILGKRNIDRANLPDFLNPKYDNQHDPFLLPDMDKAVKRLLRAHKGQEKITIYGDYDVDGVTSSALLLDAFEKFGFENVDFFLPNRFIDGYGISERAVEIIHQRGTDLIVTVDCGSLNHKEIELANSLGLDVVVTDHHNIAESQPRAIAVVNPQRPENRYPEANIFAGVGVAFKLVQALGAHLPGLENGREKWLLDLVALGTVCDIVPMTGENRQNVYWGLEVLRKTRRPGIKAMLAATSTENISTSTLGFVLGPMINSAGRLETAEKALDLVFERDGLLALEKSNQLSALNKKRRDLQQKSLKKAIKLAENYKNDPVLVIADTSFNEGVIGIIASGLVDKFKKPVFVIGIEGEIAKGSARSFGDFSASQAVYSAEEVITKGGGHDAAAGVTLPTKKVDDFRKLVNNFYKSLNLKNQLAKLLPVPDMSLNDLSPLTFELYSKIQQLEPFGPGNEEPIFALKNLTVKHRQDMGDKKQHIKYTFTDGENEIKMIKFNAPNEFIFEPGEIVDVMFRIGLNEWRGRRTVEGMILHIRESDL